MVPLRGGIWCLSTLARHVILARQREKDTRGLQGRLSIHQARRYAQPTSQWTTCLFRRIDYGMIAAAKQEWEFSSGREPKPVHRTFTTIRLLSSLRSKAFAFAESFWLISGVFRTLFVSLIFSQLCIVKGACACTSRFLVHTLLAFNHFGLLRF